LFAANAGPDIIGHGILSVASRAELGHYQPIDTYFDAWSDGPDMMESVLANGRYRDKLYGLGYSATPFLFAYRKDLLDAANIAVPTTWDALRDAARALTLRDGDRITQSGFVFPLKGGNMVEYDVFLFGNGGRFMDAQSNPTLDTPAALEAFTFLQSFLPEVNIPYDANEVNPFIKGNAAMTLINNVALRPMLENPEYAGKIGIALPPNHTEQATFCGCNMLFIGRDCKTPDAAFDFITYALSPEIELRRAAQLNVPVTRTSLLPDFIALDSNNEVRAQCVQKGIGMPRALWSTQFQTLRNEMVQSVLYSEMDAQQALTDAQCKLLEEIDMLN
ncbi:MAG: extracellular solute-binding protein, partial [Clostridia bacterium]